MTAYSVTYEITTPESAAEGLSEESGPIGHFEHLSEAIEALHGTRTNRVEAGGPLEADSFPCDVPRWVTQYNGPEFETGAIETRTLHIPDSLTPESKRRVARAAGLAPSYFRGYQPELTRRTK